MTFFIENFFSKCDRTRWKLRILPIFYFCAGTFYPLSSSPDTTPLKFFTWKPHEIWLNAKICNFNYIGVEEPIFSNKGNSFRNIKFWSREPLFWTLAVLENLDL